MSCDINCLPPTPEYILDNELVDVFEVTIGSVVDASIKDMMVKLAWNRFRRRPIGDYDYEYWLESFNDEVEMSWSWYSQIFDKYASLDDENDMSATETESMSVTSITTGSGTSGSDDTNHSTTTNNLSNTSTQTDSNTTTSSGTNGNTSTTTTTNESMPDTAVSAGTYLSSRQIIGVSGSNPTSSTVGVSGSIGISGSNTGTVGVSGGSTSDSDYVNSSNGTQSTTRTKTNTSKNMLDVEKFNKMSDELRTASMQFLSGLDKMFMNRF